MTKTNTTTPRRWVIKIGSSLVTRDGLGLDRDAIANWTEQLAELQQQGIQLVLVSSGAVIEGISRLELSARPRQIHLQQAAAAVGQMGLVQAWESCFARHGVRTAQVLLTHDDLSDRTRYLNARSTLASLITLGAIPVVNENDTVATTELCFGDNDTLAALVANLTNADLLVILTDQDGLHTADPRLDATATLVNQASVGEQSLQNMVGAGSALGRGGMQTKLSAAKLAARSGTNTVIANGRTADVLRQLAAGETPGTLLSADNEPVAARKQWLAGQLSPQGKLSLDDGAVKVLKESGRSLLAVGVQAVSGEFSRGEVVACYDSGGAEIARGLVNYSAGEIIKLKGQPSERIEALLGYAGEEEVIHRDNLVLTI
ncbi:MAG: glutamate 5-kinase [Pseudohongiellaceae bacterium]